MKEKDEEKRREKKKKRERERGRENGGRRWSDRGEEGDGRKEGGLPLRPWPSKAREKLRRTSVSGTYLPLAIGAIYSGCKASLSFGEWTFSLKVAFTRGRTKGSLPRQPGREKESQHAASDT